MKLKYILFLFILSFFLYIPNVFAIEVSNFNMQGEVTIINSRTDASHTFSVSGAPWSSIPNTYGYLKWSFAVTKIDGTSTSVNVMPRGAYVSVGNSDYVCEIGSATIENSTFNGGTYSVSCPVKMSSTGLQSVTVTFVSFPGAQTESRAWLHINSNISYVVDMNASGGSFNDTGIINSQNATTNAVNNNTAAVNNNTAAVNNVKNSVDSVNNNVMNDDVTSSTTTANGFFDNFSQNSHGLSGVVTAPLRLIRALISAQCRPLIFELPFVERNVTLQCMRPIYEDYFGVFFTLFQLITTGMISYHILINMYKKVRDLQNPKNDRIEVLNL